jgi:hypothetical protein
MNYEEKLVRCIASKLIQRKYFLHKGCFPSAKKLSNYIEQVLDDLKSQYKQLKLIRIHSEDGLITPMIKKTVDKLHF